MVDPALDRLLVELEEEGQRNDEAQSEKRFKLLNLERPTAELLSLLIESTHRRRVLELGTSSGYSTIWIGHTLRRVGPQGARLISLERSADKLVMARRNLQRAGLLGGPSEKSFIELVEGDATEIIRSLPGPFDCVFFDADRLRYPEQLELLLPKLTDEVLLAADNALSHPTEIAEYIRMVEALPGFICTLAPVGKGLHLAWRSGRA